MGPFRGGAHPQLCGRHVLKLPKMKRQLLIGLLSAALLLPAGASAKVVELGSKIPSAQVSCPTNCQALGRVTGYQGRGGAVSKPFVIPRAGKIVAFTVRLGSPDDNQRRFFQDLYGGPPQIRLSILRRSEKRGKKMQHRLVAQSPAFRLDEFFGTAPTFVLDKPLSVARKNIVAITVPTWAPAFAVGLNRDHWWRSSRAPRRCDNVSQMAQQVRLMSVEVFGCTYFTARLYYTATYVPDNRPAPKPRTTRR
jgi:hypothetical protein